MIDIIRLGTESENRICQYLHKIDGIFPVPMSNRVNIEEHTRKVLSRGVVLAACNAGEIVGICLGYANDFTDGRAYLGTLGVSSEYRSTGVGTRLVKGMIDFAKENGMKYIALHAHKNNTRAIAFYQKNGFLLTEDKNKPYEESVYLTAKLK